MEFPSSSEKYRSLKEIQDAINETTARQQELLSQLGYDTKEKHEQYEATKTKLERLYGLKRQFKREKIDERAAAADRIPGYSRT